MSNKVELLGTFTNIYLCRGITRDCKREKNMTSYDNITDYILQNFENDDIRTLAEHGASGGVSGLIYYAETSKLYDIFKDDIWGMIEDDLYGSDKTPLEYIAELNGGENVTDDTTMRNLLVWYAFEICASLAMTWVEEEEKA